MDYLHNYIELGANLVFFFGTIYYLHNYIELGANLVLEALVHKRVSVKRDLVSVKRDMVSVVLSKILKSLKFSIGVLNYII
jgi:hypothetical protein